jgi:hypothetical protein
MSTGDWLFVLMQLELAIPNLAPNMASGKSEVRRASPPDEEPADPLLMSQIGLYPWRKTKARRKAPSVFERLAAVRRRIA